MLEALERPWSPGADTPCAGMRTKAAPGMLGGVLRELEESADYAFLRGHAEFEAILAEYRGKQ